MQKLTEASDRKKGRRMRKEKRTPPTRGGSSFLFQQWPAGWQHLNLPAASEANVFALRRHVGLTFHIRLG